jgi:hypothetical protein
MARQAGKERAAREAIVITTANPPICWNFELARVVG